jgi:hypothetical protein
MRLQIESTDIIASIDGVECRVWNGVSEIGEQIFLFVHRVATRGDLTELLERPAARIEKITK